MRSGRGWLVRGGGLLVVLGLAVLWLPRLRKGPPRPNIVLLTIESLRTDHLGCYGGPRPTSPVLDRLAAESVVYEQASSVTSWTLASHASLFTGLYPSAHQTTGPEDRLGDAYTTLAELLGEAGYQTAGVVSGPYLRREYNLAQGFEHYDESPSSPAAFPAHGDVTNPALERALEAFLAGKRDPRRPLFLFAYYWDPHYDYIPPPPFDGSFVEPGDEPVEVRAYETSGVVTRDLRPAQLAYVKAQYDGEILWTDAHLGRLFARLRELGLWENTLLLVTADHGEAFYEHGFKGHKNDLHREVVQVPLLVKYPGPGPRGRDPRPASLVDVMPTVIEAAGLRHPGPLDGRSLREPEPDPERPIFSELEVHWFLPGGEAGEPREVKGQWLGVRRGRYRLLTMPEWDLIRVYDLQEDPEERFDRSGDLAEPKGELLGLLVAWRRRMAETAGRFEKGGRVELEPQDLERLRSLGYLR